MQTQKKWDRDEVQSHLVKAGLAEKVTLLESVDSTMKEAHRLLAQGLRAPMVVLAKEQTAGKGRQGRTWHSPDAGSIYSSFTFRPDCFAPQLQLLPLWIGVSLAQWLKDDFGILIGLKWPNDLMWQKRKLGGILVETCLEGLHVKDCVVGIGLNVNANPSDWPEPFRDKMASLSLIKGEAFDFAPLTSLFLKNVFNAYERFMDGQYVGEFEEKWAEFDALKGQQVTIQHQGIPLHGEAKGIDERGYLSIKLESGEEVLLHSGDVTIGSFNF
jgi:BirA family biotin operon repressor/biotin-[acetyl-CoA-carboxylase] ligase